MIMDSIDFSQSFCTWQLNEQASYGRFSVDALVRTQPPVTATPQTFLLLSEVMAADVYGRGPRLLYDPPFQFAAIFGPDQYRVLRTHAPWDPRQDSMQAHADRFSAVNPQLAWAPAQRITETDALIAATLAPHPLVAHIQLHPGIELVFPVRHINVQTDTRQFQLETGPILMPDPDALSQAGAIDQLHPAFIACQHWDRAEFLLRDTRPLLRAPADSTPPASQYRFYRHWRQHPVHLSLGALSGVRRERTHQVALEPPYT